MVKGPWLTVDQTGEYLDLASRSVRELEYRGVLPGRRLGSSLRFSVQELNQLLISCRQRTLAELRTGKVSIPPGPLGPLMNIRNTINYLGLSSDDALRKRVARLQIPVYRISQRIMLFRDVEIDQSLAGNPLKLKGKCHIMTGDVCLPEGKEV